MLHVLDLYTLRMHLDIMKQYLFMFTPFMQVWYTYESTLYVYVLLNMFVSSPYASTYDMDFSGPGYVIYWVSTTQLWSYHSRTRLSVGSVIC